MLISEAARKSHTTKKAIEYYVEQQLLDLQTQKNGYRQFTEKDIEKLKKISVLRRFGLSVQEIKHILDDPKQETIQRIIEKTSSNKKKRKQKTLCSNSSQRHRTGNLPAVSSTSWKKERPSRRN